MVLYFSKINKLSLSQCLSCQKFDMIDAVFPLSRGGRGSFEERLHEIETLRQFSRPHQPFLVFFVASIQTCQASHIWRESPAFYLSSVHVLHAKTFHTFFYKFMHFRFSCSPYISLKLWQLQLRFTHFTYSNLAAMSTGILRVFFQQYPSIHI